MLLRSSSTPVLGSLISSISESPNHHHYQPEVVHHPTNKHPPTTVPHSLNKVSFHHAGSQNFTFSCNSSPISPSVSEFSLGTRCSSNGFRRAQSEGNLEGLANASSNIDEISLSNPIKKFPGRTSAAFLETIPSFSIHKSTSRYEDSEYEDEEEEQEGEETEDYEDQLFKNSMTSDMEKRRQVNAHANMGFEKESEENSQMYLARGLGISGLDIDFGSGNGPYGGNGGYGCGSGAGDGDENDLEEHYKKMVQENPGNSLLLRNYAQFLYQTKQDPQGAEDYYSRTILIDPKDGDILSQYAKLVWELHHDEERATGYFERAVQAASEDSHVHAAYASFLWEMEDADEDDKPNDPRVQTPFLHRGAMASATA